MGKKVLVVDDEKLIVKGLRFSLEQDGMEVDCAFDGEEAINLAKQTEYDVVLLDVMLPKHDGFEVCQAIREFSEMPIIMLTAKGGDMDKILGLEYGAPKVGNIVNQKGDILGKHSGLYKYTIGQRKGLGISYKVPLFVIGFNPLKNEVIVGEENELYKKEIIVKDINLLLFDKIKDQKEVEVKTRYSSKMAKAKISQETENTIKVIFDEPQRAITPGQSAVFYIDDIVVGGGKIED